MTRLLAAALAAAIALTSVPAHADPYNRRINPDAAAAALFGLVTLGIIAHQVQKDRDDKKKKEKEKKKAYAHKAPRVIEPRHRHGHAYAHDHGRHIPEVRAITVPSDCARRVRFNGETRTAFGAPCLRRSGVTVAHLPNRCARRVDVGGRGVTAYGARCLHRAGVRIH